MGIQQLALIRNHTLEFQVKITYQLNKILDFYFYGSLKYLKYLRLPDLRRKKKMRQWQFYEWISVLRRF